MYYSFKASRITGHGNALFPDKIEIDDNMVVYYKGAIIGYKSTMISRDSIASVSISSGLLFADVTIESRGGNRVVLYGFTRSDAKDIVNLLS